jgi:hypothetical protein
MDIHQLVGMEVPKSLGLHDAKNLLQKLNNPPLGIGHYNFLSHPIKTSMVIFTRVKS